MMFHDKTCGGVARAMVAGWMCRAILLMAAGVLPGGQSRAEAQATGPAERVIAIERPGEQSVQLARVTFAAQTSGRVRCTARLEEGDADAALVLRMLGPGGEDLAERARSLGFGDPTRTFRLQLQRGADVTLDEAFVSAAGTSSIDAQLLIQARTPARLRITSPAIEESAPASRPAGEDGGGRRLTWVTSPEPGFTYPANLLPPVEAEPGDAAWRAVGDGAQRITGDGQLPRLVVTDGQPGTWESPRIDVGQWKQLHFQAFMRFDPLATPQRHPFQFVFRDEADRALPPPPFLSHWRWASWIHAYGQWIPASLSIPVPPGARTVQLALALPQAVSNPWRDQYATSRSNFGRFELAQPRLWGTAEPHEEIIPPLGHRPWSGDLPGPGPFIASAGGQENSVILATRSNALNNLYFESEGPPELRVWVENCLPIRRGVDIHGRILDWQGRPAGEVKARVDLAPYEKRDVAVPLPALAAHGVYSAELAAQQDGTSVGEGVARWAWLRQRSDRADRHHEQYPFYFHPLFMADDHGYKDAQRLGQESAVLRAMGVRGLRLQCRLWGFDAANVEASVRSIQKLTADFHAVVRPHLEKSDLEAIISFFPRPASPIPASEAELAAWRTYVAAAVEGYRPIRHFVFGNEEVGQFNGTLDEKPGVWGYRGSARDFVRQFLAGRQAARDARPEVAFIPGQASDVPGNFARLFFAAGATAQDVDGWSMNSYGEAATMWARLSSTLQSHGVELSSRIGIIPEIGPTADARGPRRVASEKEQALDVIYRHMEVLSAAPWIKAVCWFTTSGRGPDNHCVFDADWDPRPAAGTYLTMTDTLGAGRPARIAELQGIHAYLWQRPDGSRCGVLWAAGNQQVRLRVSDGSPDRITVRDAMGNDRALPAPGGVVSVELTESPVYLLGIDRLQDAAQVNVQWTLIQAAGGQRTARLRLANLSAEPESLAGRLEGSASVAWKKPAIPRIELAPRQATDLDRQFLLMDDQLADWKTLAVSLQVNDGYSLVSRWSSSLLTAGKAAQPPQLDGEDEWQTPACLLRQRGQVVSLDGRPQWDGPADLSARCQLLWDEQHLYIRAQVTDDVHVQATAPSRMFLNDNVQLGFVAESDGAYGGYTELSLGGSEGRPAVFEHSGPAPGRIGEDAARLEVQRDEAAHATVYLASIRWKTLGIPRPEPGMRLRLGILVNDSDRPDAPGSDRTAIQWFGGIFQKDASKLGDVTLTE